MLVCALVLLNLTVGTDPPAEPTPEEVFPVRSVRRLTVAANVGYNSLTGLGVQVGYNFTPHISADAGVGYSLTNGGRVGARVRYNFLTSAWSPFVGAAALYNWQSDSWCSVNFDFGCSNTYTTYPTLSLAPMVGATVQAHNGFFALFAVGWKWRVLGRRYDPGSDTYSSTSGFFGDGPMVESSVGYTF